MFRIVLKQARCLFFIVGVNLFLLLNLTGLFGYAQPPHYSIDISKAGLPLKSELNLGGTGINGQKISVNNYYISKNGKPIIPITGEFHFSRYPKQYWDESIKKIKAGGINIIATYVFWNIHEEKEGRFDWSGDKDLREFVKLCAANHIDVIVRLGLFCHGEIRNGGLPDWLLSKPFSVRSNDAGYLHYAELLYKEIAKQLQGLYFKDGGPVIGVQIENEFQHSAAPWGLTYPGQPYDFTASERDRAATHEGVSIADRNNPYADLGNDHMMVLKSLAIKAGIKVPLYTATGWGYAAIIPNASLPVTAAYSYPTWTDKMEPSPFYLYKNMHRVPDYSPVRYEPTDYPAFAAELGSGIMSTYNRRPIVPAESLDALINRCLGSGANGIGYYMYHGGSTPVGGHYFFNDEAYGYPKISYDFQAPVGEYGQVRPSFQRLKLLHYFVNDFAAQLAPMETFLPADNALIKPDNLSDLRYAVRAKDDAGFLFINNFQDHAALMDKAGISINIKTRSSSLRIPAAGGFNLKAGENAVLPFNLDINGVRLQYATAQLLLKNDGPQNPYYVFFIPPGIKPEFNIINTGNVSFQNIAGATFSTAAGHTVISCRSAGSSEFVLAFKGKKTRVLIVEKSMALRAFALNINGERKVVFTDALVLATANGMQLQRMGVADFDLTIYPKAPLNASPTNGKLTEGAADKLFANYRVKVKPLEIKPVYSSSDVRKLSVAMPSSLPAGVNDIFLNIDYIGDTGMGFINGELMTDQFYNGTTWAIGLKRFMLNKEAKDMDFYFRPLYKNATYLADLDPKLVAEITRVPQTVKVLKVGFTPEYKTELKFN